MKEGKLIRVSVLIVLILAGYQWLIAAYLKDVPVQVSQPNGTVINCFASGDEFHNWLHDAAGYTIIQHPDTGYYTYAIQSGDTVAASGLIVGMVDPSLSGLTPRINISKEEYQKKRAAFPVQDTRDYQTTGTINNIVIFIRFADQAEFGDDISVYNGWFNSNTSSLKNYFIEASYNQLTVNSTFYPAAINNVVHSWQTTNPRSYYLPYNSNTNPNGFHNLVERQTREHALLRSAVNAVSSQIPTNLNIDANNDGRVDNVVFIISGHIDTWNALLWPHEWKLSTGDNVYINGKRVYDYNFHLQIYLTNYNVGVLSHEFCHTLGFPDLYDYDNTGNPVGPWDVMATDTNPPQHMGAYMKWKYGHWISSVPVISGHNNIYTLNPITSCNNNVYRINTPNSTNEYFIVEYRNKSGTYENQLPDLGLLVYRINTSAGDGNADGPPYEVYVHRPSSGIDHANYSTPSRRIEINETTDPTPFLSNNEPGGLQLYVMGPNESTIKFRIGPPPAKIHGYITSASFPENTFIPDLLVTLRRTETHEVVAQTRPYWYQAIEYDLYADPGSYYLEYEIFRPSEGKFAYPVLSGNITVEENSWIQDITLPPVTLNFTPYNINLVKVSSNAADPYFKDIMTALQRIQTAVNSGYNGNSVTLDVLPGNYFLPQTVGSFSYTNTANNALSLVIRGAGNGAIIEPQFDDHYTLNINRTNISFQNIKFSRASNNWNYYLTFHGTNNSCCTFTGCLFGKSNTALNYKSSTSFINQSGISLINCSITHNDNTDYGYGVVKFVNCSNINIDTCSFSSNGSFMGGAIHFSQSDNVQVVNSLFENNGSWAPESEIQAGTPGGAIYVSSSSNMNITNNRFIHNTTTGTGGAVYINSTSPVHIEGNLFKDNILHHIGLINTQSDAMGFDNCAFTANDYVARNIIHSGFAESPEHRSDFIAIGSNCTGTLNIANGVFIKGSFDTNNEKRIVRSSSPVNMNFSNCVFQTRDVNADFLNSTYPPQPVAINVSYSLFDNGFAGVTNAIHNSCQITDMGLDSNYSPIWNQTQMSPCIDAGTGANDADGTPADIGAVPTFSHAYWKYTFRNGYNADVPSQRNEVWHWVSYPVINTITDGGRGADVFFNELLGKHFNAKLLQDVPDVLQDIRWREDNVQHDILWHVDEMNPELTTWTIAFNNNIDTDLSHHSVTSQQGYKVQLIPFGDAYPTYPESVVLHESGQVILPASYVNLHGSANLYPDQPYENWVGYFSPYCSWPQEAFSSIWDDIIMIKAKDWCLYRSRSNGNFSALNGTMYPLKCGDMVIVVTRNDHPHFQWNYQTPVDPRTKPRSEYFTYDEKPDYVPVTIDLMGIEKTGLKEIALEINGVCKGAVVVESDVEQLCAYLDIDEKLTDGNVELIYYYDHGKNQPQSVQSMPLTKNSINCEYINGGITYPVYTIKAGSSDQNSNTVSVTELEQNSPNPFNSITKINYALKSAGEMSLDIFNVKGQLVRTICCGKSDKGHFSTVWNGKDNRGNTCSSGIYFCKLRTGDSTHVRKMMLMK